MQEDQASLNQYRALFINLIAIILAILDVILIFITLLKHVPALQEAVVCSFPEVLFEPRLWTVAAETMFYCAILVTLYGLISLWLPEMHFILWAGAGLAVLAGSVYLLASATYYQDHGMGAPIQQGGFMFLVSLAFPFLVYKLLKRERQRKLITQNLAPSQPDEIREISQLGETISTAI
jgi:hypothetical protein